MRFMVPALALFFVACGEETHTELGEVCTELAEACHPAVDMGDEGAITCHDVAHEGDEAACQTELDACVALCEAVTATMEM